MSSNSKNSPVKTIVLGVSCLVALLGLIFTFFGTALSYSSEGNSMAIGPVLAFFFGGEATITTTLTLPAIGAQTSTVSGPLDSLSALGLVAFILYVLGLVLLIVHIVVNLLHKKWHPALTLCEAVLLIVAGILLFCCKGSFIAAMGGSGEIGETLANELSLGWGVILPAIFALVGGVGACGSILIKK